MIGQKLQLPLEDTPPFETFGLLQDFNGVDINQTKQYIEIACPEYIDRILRSHNWFDINTSSHPSSPLPEDSIHKLYAEVLGPNGGGPKEGTAEHLQLQDKMGFSYRTLLGELMFAYVSCRPDIAYAVTTLSKFSNFPTKLHYTFLKGVVFYLKQTKNWGIRYHRNCSATDFHDDLPEGNFDDQPRPLPDNFPSFPDLDPTELSVFVDAAYANDPRKRRSTTGFAILLAGGAVVYRSKTQSVTALSSTEAEFFAAIAAAKLVKYMRSLLQ